MLRNCTLLLLFCLVAALVPAYGQRGCTDPRALNFNAGATVNDGSCQYAVTTTPLVTRTPLANDVAETSGLQFTSQALWTVNDSGNTPDLFALDAATGTVRQRVRISNFGNIDWEDLAADAEYLYVGDFGNNSGDRQDLQILRIRKADIGPAPAATVTAQAIRFTYPDQTIFTPGTNNHNFDCEALLYFNDSLHLFTKNWADRQTRHYTVPAVPGTHVAQLKTSFNVNGLITAASINTAGTEACLLGYNASTGATFLWLLYDFQGGNFLRGNKRRLELPNALQIGQAEGVTFTDRYHLYLSNERISNIITVPARLYELSTSQWLAAPMAANTAVSASESMDFQVFPNPASQNLTVRRTTYLAHDAAIELQDLCGRNIASALLEKTRPERTVDLRSVPTGTYILKLKSNRGTLSRKIVIQ